ncbi:16S rRNA (cytosine(1402)-N(4))-methyltransferase RsmH [Rhodovulum sp. DZ06]|uniref:16S rRNA (cytosine(1402)-N(4))-methyltransferase RsmH n=1 Tax=Rhodovulum sp. DZ06 TaxID=3425126 RepID=UPI003D33216F
MTGPDPIRAAAEAAAAAGHAPVMPGEAVGALVDGASPEVLAGVFLDGTMGAGGYTRALALRVAPHGGRVFALDRDPSAHRMAEAWAADHPNVTRIEGAFSALDRHAAEAGSPALSGVVLDIGVSSMQIDRDARGFSFMRSGPLDMRMGDDGPTAADLVAHATEGELADILFHYGEERASRRVARAIKNAGLIETTKRLAEVISGALPRPKPGQIHPATRSFQALRIAVNDELGELVRGLSAAERALAPGGRLAVVTFHSLEDRIVKRFLADRCGEGPGGSRHAPAVERPDPAFTRSSRKAVEPSKAEVEANPRARSARLRAAERTAAHASTLDPMARENLRALGAPDIPALQAPLRRIGG